MRTTSWRHPQMRFKKRLSQAATAMLVRHRAVTARCGRVVVRVFQIAQPIATGLGWRARAMKHKLRSLVQRTFAGASLLAKTTATLQQIRCLCVDVGTEMSLPDACGMEFKDAMPPGMKAAIRLGHDALDGGDFGGLFFQPSTIALASSR